MRKIGMLLLGLGLIGCARSVIEPEPKPTDRNAKRTVGIGAYASQAAWSRSVYYRPLDDAVIAMPVFIALAADGTACLIDGMIWGSWRENDVVVCQNRWRFQRAF
jgi:hypothetical protein